MQVLGEADGVVVYGAASGISAIVDVDAGSTVTAWGQATEIGAAGDGNFTFGAGSGTVFGMADDDQIFSFITDGAGVNGVKDFDNGTIQLAADTEALDVNVDTIPEQTMTFSSEEDITLTVEAQKVVGVEGITSGGSVSGIVDAVVSANGPIAVNGENIDITDADERFNVACAHGALSSIRSVYRVSLHHNPLRTPAS